MFTSLYFKFKKINNITPRLLNIDLATFNSYYIMYYEFNRGVNLNIKRRQVLKHAQQLFVEKGIMATSIQDIITKSNISKGTFYNYFSSKNDCLKSILKLGDEETHIRRQELLIGQNIADRRIFKTQVAVRLQVNTDLNLLPILEAVFHSQDGDLSTFAKNLHAKELHWLTGRFIDVYGDEVRSYAVDCSILFSGMLQHTLFFYKSSIAQPFDLLEIIDYLICRMDEMIPAMIANEKVLFNENSIHHTPLIGEQEIMMKEQLLDNLVTFHKQLKQEQVIAHLEYIEFLVEEFKRDEPRYQLIKTITKSFRSAFEESNYRETAFKLAAEIWMFIKAENVH